jgi:hypothetical protein
MCDDGLSKVLWETQSVACPFMLWPLVCPFIHPDNDGFLTTPYRLMGLVALERGNILL